jgi:hypothetical protein
MGQWLTKLHAECSEVSEQSKEKSTPIMERDDMAKRRMLKCDPRSPTVEINRTPIQVPATPIRRIDLASTPVNNVNQ